jgi:autotransporter translocation and assembly factor TamB
VKRGLLIALVLSIGMPLLFLGWLLKTEGGLQWTYRSALPSIPGKLEMQSLSGTLADGVVVNEILFEQQDTVLRAQRIELEWNPWALLKARFEVDSLRIEALQITLPAAAEDTTAAASPTELPVLDFPLALQLDNIQIDDIDIDRDGSQYHLSRARLSASADEDGIEIESFSIATDTLEVSINGTVNPRANYPHDLAFTWTTGLPSGARLSGDGRISGDLSLTRLTQQVAGAARLQQTLELSNLLDQPAWQSSVDVAEFDTAVLDATLPPVSGALQTEAQGDLETARITGALQVESANLGPVSARFALRSLDGERRFSGMQIESLVVQLLQGELSASGQLDWSPTLAWQAQVTTSGLDPSGLFPQWPGAIDARLATRGEMKNDALVASASISELRGSLRDYPVSLQADLEWQNQGLDIERLNFSSGETRITAEGRVAETLALKWSLDSRDLAELYPEAQGSLDASGSLDGPRDAPRIIAVGNGKSLGLPGYRLGEVRARAEMDLFQLQAFDIELAAKAVEIQGQRLQTLEIRADSGQIKANVVADAASAQIELKGKFDGEYWRGELTRSDIQTANYTDWRLSKPAAVKLSREASSTAEICLHNDLDSRLCSSVEGKQQDWKIDLDIKRLALQMLAALAPTGLKPEGLANATAVLRFQYPDRLLGQAKVDLEPGTASYNLSQQRPLRLDYQAGNFDLVMTAAGLEALTRLTLDNGDSLQATARLPGANLLALNTRTQVIQADARLELRDLGIVDALIDEIDELSGEVKLDVALSGTLDQPRVQGKASLSGGSLRLPRQKIRLRQIGLNAEGDNSERLNFQATAALGNGTIKLQGNTRLNAEAGWPSSVAVTATGIDVSDLPRSWLPPQVKVDGLLDSTANFQYRAPDRLEGEIEVNLPTGTLHYPLLAGTIEQWQYRDGKLVLVMNDLGIAARAGILLGDDNRFEAESNLPGARLLALDMKNQPLTAKARFNLRQLDVIEALLPEIDQPRGDLKLELDASGTLAQPKLVARAEILDASVNIPRLGLRIKKIELKGSTDAEQRFKFELGARSGEGWVKLDGSSQLDAASGWPTSISIRGENFEVSRIPEAVVNLSPDLSVEIRHRSIDIQGDLHVPYAKLQPKDVTTAARVSSDTVIIGGEKPPEPKWTITTAVNLILGERVSFFGYGFEGQLGGKLLITEQAGRVTSGTGEITIPQGRYRAYGQRLDIENGRLLFTGSPVNNPGLDIRATRTSNGVIAGLQVRGNLRKPQIELFSIPAMGQTDTLSYLLLGRPAEGASGEDGAMMAQAALALGLAGGDRLARSIGDRFGLDEMRVESSDSGDQASLVVGRYLSPRLYVSYGVGLIEPINSLNLRYKISEKWQLEAESGINHGADLLYTIER